MFSSRLVRRTAAFASATLIASGALVVIPALPAQAAGLGITKSGPPSVLVGDSATYALSASNPAGPLAQPEYNVSYRDVLPVGVNYTSGSTAPADIGDPAVLVDAITGQQTLVWANVSDLQVGGDFGFSFKAVTNAAVLPVGSSISNAASTYASTNPRQLPRFTATGVAVPGTFTQTASSTPVLTSISALKITKAEPSPEGELMRGVHDHTTVYTLKATNNSVAATTGVTVVDLVPAGLEFLGCGGIDNSTGVNRPEYPGAPLLTATPAVVGCQNPARVETVVNPPGFIGVFTQVTWTVGTMAPGAIVTLPYAAGIPLNANAPFAAPVPSPLALGQTANLDNNTGPSTREGAAAQALTNTVTATGTYTGAVSSGGSTGVNVTDSITRTAQDLAMQKSVVPSEFTAGQVATYNLALESSEYASSSGILITDTLPNGTCPLSATTNYVSGGPAECAPGAGFAPTATLTPGGTTAVSFTSVTQNADGTFTVVFSPLALADNQTAVITYSSRMRTSFTGGSLTGKPTSSGDEFTNTVALTGSTTPAPATGVVGVQTVTDSSSATQTTDGPSINKTIQPNALPYMCDLGPYVESDTAAPGSLVFRKGSRICFELRVNFSSKQQTRNPAITDFVPPGTSYEPGSATLAPANNVADISFNEAASAAGTANPMWVLGAIDGTGVHFVPAGAVFAVRFSVLVDEAALGSVPDVVGNIMKYRSENNAGRAVSLRDVENFSIAPAPAVSLRKGVAQINGLPVVGNGPNVDGLQVQQGDVVRFRVDVANNGSAASGNDFSARGLDIWDVLPVGIRCSSITSTTGGGVCTDPGDAAQPTFGQRATQSAIRWTFAAADDSNAISPGASGTYFYNMAVAAEQSVSSNLVNTASIASFQSFTNKLNVAAKYFPAANVDTTVNSSQYDAPAATDPSNVITPGVVVAKTALTSITETNNSTSQAVIGELVTYTLTAVVPANTTAYNGKLSDTLPAGITFVSAAAGFSAVGTLPATDPLPPGVTQSGTDGGVTLPAVFNNSTASPVMFRATIVAQVWNLDPPNNNTQGSARTNTAKFTSTLDAAGATPIAPRTATATITLVHPLPTLKKTTNDADGIVTAGQDIIYTLAPVNAVGRPILHDTFVVDCLPAGMLFVAYLSASQGAALPATAGTGANGCPVATARLSWQLGDLLPSATAATLMYKATVNVDAAGSATYQNSAVVSGSSLSDGKSDPVAPDNPLERSYSGTANATVKVAGATLTKTTPDLVRTVGQTSTFTVTASLPADVNFYDASIIDRLPTGFDVASVTTVSVACINADSTVCASPTAATRLTDGPTVAASAPVGWLLGDIASGLQSRTVTLVYSARVGDVVTASRSALLTNNATIKWNLTNKADPTSASAIFDKTSPVAAAPVKIVEPRMIVSKGVSDTTPEPGQVYTYTVTAKNSGANDLSDAFNVLIVDTIPVGVVVNPASITSGGVLSGAGPNGGGTITWSVNSVAVNASGILTYQATLAASSTLTTASLTNSVDIPSYASLPTGGRIYDDVTPAIVAVTPTFPFVTAAKAAITPAPGYLGEQFAWSITLTNTGGGTAYGVDALDTMPLGWTYVSGSASVSVNGGPATSVAPTLGTSGSRQTLSWTDLGDLPSGGKIKITLLSLPSASVPTAPGIGAAIAQTNDVSTTASDATGATGNATGPHNGPQAAAATRIDSADLATAKNVSVPFVAGRTGAWSVVISNNGPDTAVGPFTVQDTVPGGVSFVSAVGPGWSCTYDGPTRLVACTRSVASNTLASGNSFPPITMSAAVAADVASGTSIANTATVTARTYDPTLPNNTGSVVTTVSTLADLAILKNLSGELVAGQAATYTLDVSNLGPSVAVAPVSVTDTLPAGTTYVAASGTGWSCTSAAGTVTCTRGDLGVGVAPQIAVVVAVSSGQTAAAVNTAVVSSGTPDPVPGNNKDTVTTAPALRADLGIEKRHTGAFIAGSPATYRLTVTNFGPSDAASPVTIVDTLPTGLTYTSSTDIAGAWTCAVDAFNAQLLTCTLTGPLVDGAIATVDVNVAVGSGVTGSVTNNATVSSPTTDPNPGNNTDPDDSGISTLADLAIVKTQSGVVIAGQRVTYTLAVRNIGPSDAASPVTVTDVVPAGLSFGQTSSATGTGWTCAYAAVDRTITCTHNGLAGSTAAPDITLVLDVDSDAGPAVIRNLATVDSPTNDPDLRNNTSRTDVTVVDSADMSIVKSRVGTGAIAAGTSTSFTLVASNKGPSDADDVTVLDTFPTGMTPTAADGIGWTCAIAGQVVLCDRLVVAAGTSAPAILIAANVDASVPDGTNLVNKARVATSTPGDDLTNNTSSATVPIVGQADLSLVKSHRETAVNAGDIVIYDLAVNNAGPSDAVAPVEVVDTLPAGLSYVGVVGSAWTCADVTSIVTCTLVSPPLAAGAAAPMLTLLVKVDPMTRAGVYDNTAVVSSGTTDLVPGNNTDTDTVLVGELARVAIVKTHTGTARIGDPLTFTLTVTNSGPSTARDLVVSEVLPAGLTYSSVVGGAWTCGQASDTLTCSVAQLAPNAPSQIQVTVMVGAAAYASVANTATVTSTTPDDDTSDNTSTDVVTVPAQVDLRIAKTHMSPLIVGSNATYRLTVSNLGPTSDPGPVTVVDVLPTGLSFVSAAGTGWVCSQASVTVTCLRASALPVGTDSVITLVVAVEPAAYPEVVNTATVTTPSEDLNPADNSATDPAPVTPLVKLAIVKGLVSFDGSVASWRVTVTNLGPNVTVSPLTIIDVLPTGLTFISAQGASWTCGAVSATVTCIHPTALKVGVSADVLINTTVTAVPGSTITNVASGSGGGNGSGSNIPITDEAVLNVPINGSSLPHTGAEVLSLLLYALMLLVGGIVLRSSARRPRQ